MRLRLEHNKQIIYETDSGAIAGELVIGRSHTCTWAVPETDTVISGRHASITRKGDAWVFADLDSKNGSFHLGKRIATRRLEPGDRITLGDCLLLVEDDAGAPGAGQRAPQILVRSGPARGQKKPIQAPRFTIGSDPSSSLVLIDDLVSRRHAEVMLKDDGSCWVRDLGSKNGTLVNGMLLRDGKERLLKDGDVMGIAHLEFEFQDGTERKTTRQALVRLGVMAATLLVLLAAYGAYTRMKPSAARYLEKARDLASREEFDAARRDLNAAMSARQRNTYELEIEEVRGQLDLWESTVKLWRQAQKSLAAEQWVDASRDLGTLQSRDKDAWGWSEQGVRDRDQAALAKGALDAFLRGGASLKRDDVTVTELARDLEAVRGSIARLSEKPPDYLAKLVASLETCGQGLESAIKEFGTLEQILVRLESGKIDIASVRADLEKLRGSAQGALRRRIDVVHAPLSALAQSEGQIKQAIARVHTRDFPGALKSPFELPPADLCALDPRLSAARAVLDKEWQNLQGRVAQLDALQSDISRRLADPACGRVLDDLAKPETLQKVLSVDTLASPIVKRSRTAPVGEFDRILGTEEFYQFLAALPGQVDPAMMASLPFRSGLSQAAELLGRLRKMKRVLTDPENQALLGGALAEDLARYEQTLAKVDPFVGQMIAKAASGTGREALIAGGIAVYLTTSPVETNVGSVPLSTWVVNALKKNRDGLQKLSAGYDVATPADQVKIREEILAAGLPGDPIVRKMWAARDQKE
jgi:pSer/pThr/pTyr-binding forkhead associated (FHA) protein